MSSELNESPPRQEEKTSTPMRRRSLSFAERIALLAGMILFFAASDFSMTCLWQEPESMTMLMLLGFSLGIFVTQLDLIGLWTALGPGRMIVRLPWGLLAVTLAYVLHQSGYQALRPHVGVSQTDRLMLLGAMLLGWFAITVCFFALRLVWRWRMVRHDASAEQSAKFHLRHLILGTALCGMTLALLNWFGYPIANLMELEWMPLFLLGAIAAVNLLILVPALLAAFANSSWGKRPLLLAGYCTALSLAQFFVIVSVLGYPPRAEKVAAFLIAANLTQCFGLILSLHLCRWAGYELRVVDGVRTIESAPAKVAVEEDPWTEED